MKEERRPLTLDDYYQEQENRMDKKYNWLRQLIVVASVIFSITASFHKDFVNSYISKYLYDLAEVSIGFGILTLSIALYGEVHRAGQKLKAVARALSDIYENKKVEETTVLDKPYIYRLSENLSYVSLFVGMASLVLYSVIQ